MLEITELGTEKVVGMLIDGKVSTRDFEKVERVIEERLRLHEKISLYVEVISFEGMSAEALFKDITLALRNWRRFEKEAVVTDTTWLRYAAEIGDKLTPGIDVKVFKLAENEAARQWVRGEG
jgi:hypothetical protein